MAVCQNLVPLVNIKIAGKWMFIPLKMVFIGIDPYPHKTHIFHGEFHHVKRVPGGTSKRRRHSGDGEAIVFSSGSRASQRVAWGILY